MNPGFVPKPKRLSKFVLSTGVYTRNHKKKDVRYQDKIFVLRASMPKSRRCQREASIHGPKKKKVHL